jgi:hypothetical protein
MKRELNSMSTLSKLMLSSAIVSVAVTALPAAAQTVDAATEEASINTEKHYKMCLWP